MSGFGYEIDFLPVGNGNKSGDAIAIRYSTQSDYKVMVVDGGTKESGQKLVEHIREYYGTRVDYVVNTHPDQDHASGLTEVLENLEVGELWIHRPWVYAKDIINYIYNNPNLWIDGRVTAKSFEERLSGDYYKYAKELELIAKEKGIKINEPYESSKIGEFIVLSPNIEWHLLDLIPNSDKTKEIQSTEDSKPNFLTLGLEKLFSISETLGIETLRNSGETSRENESSVILYANFNNKGVLLTGDAGNEALQNAYDFATSIGINISQNLQFIQIPHHGSRRNVSPKILNQIIGAIGKKEKESVTAFVSAGKNDTNHPRRVITNAFIRRGCKVIETKGSTIHHHRNMPEREGWTTATPTPFYDKVESYD
ncbi:ComEC/Rec2 family competence protein [Helicobacter sp. 23-1048]